MNAYQQELKAQNEAFFSVTAAKVVTIEPTPDHSQDYLMLHSDDESQPAFAMVTIKQIFDAIQKHGLLSIPRE